MSGFSMTGDAKTGMVLIGMSLIWFLLAFALKHHRGVTTAIYSAVGIIFFALGVYNLLIAFQDADFRQKVFSVLVPVAVLAGIIAIIVLMRILRNGIGNDESDEEDYYDENDYDSGYMYNDNDREEDDF